MDDDAIRVLVKRLSRPHPSGGSVIERAAILAEGAQSAAVLTWITAHDGEAEEVVLGTSARGLHSARDDRARASARAPRRYVLPPGALA